MVPSSPPDIRREASSLNSKASNGLTAAQEMSGDLLMEASKHEYCPISHRKIGTGRWWKAIGDHQLYKWMKPEAVSRETCEAAIKLFPERASLLRGDRLLVKWATIIPDEASYAVIRPLEELTRRNSRKDDVIFRWNQR
ncbi:hypothetical protein GIB67_001034 [Kingdonia uniflora]|uniref:Uncharacterized protein n=1 Tax=Kingdonia uniflora TaxID=39325 RepID=A0A7J7MFZ8_9MAGN|nr:hypothetical protein GIB67_001034 [Kingdonia uniflora]